MKRRVLDDRLRGWIESREDDVFLRDEFSNFGGYDQVGRSLRKLVRQGKLVKLGYGVYGKAAISPFDGRPSPAKGIRTMAEAVLKKLGVKPQPSSADVAYSSGRSTQVPTGRVIRVDKRVRRRIGFNGSYVVLERSGS